MRFKFTGLLALLMCVTSVHASTLRLACDGPAEGADVSVNGVFKGQCPLDVQVKAGKVKVTASKKIDGKSQSFEQELRFGEGVSKRVEITFGNAASASSGAAVEIDTQAVARQRYAAEMDAYNQSISSCLPKHAIELRRVTLDAESAMKAAIRECRQRNSRDKSDDYSWEVHYRKFCGPSTLEERESYSYITSAEKVLNNFETDAKLWCAAQFTKPRSP